MNAVDTITERIVVQSIPVKEITLHEDLQPRTQIDQAVLDDYAQRMLDGADFPKPVVFQVNGDRFLADGFHRYFAHEALGRAKIEVEIREGTFEDAVAYSVQANTKHGKRRSEHDTRRAYRIAKSYKLIDPLDVEAVASKLGVSMRWAYQLTDADRTIAKRRRDEEVRTLRDKGLTERDIAAEVGVDHATVHRVVQNCTVQKCTKPGTADPIPGQDSYSGNPSIEGIGQHSDGVGTSISHSTSRLVPGTADREVDDEWGGLCLFIEAVGKRRPLSWYRTNRINSYDHAMRLDAPRALPWLRDLVQFLEEDILS